MNGFHNYRLTRRKKIMMLEKARVSGEDVGEYVERSGLPIISMNSQNRCGEKGIE